MREQCQNVSRSIVLLWSNVVESALPLFVFSWKRKCNCFFKIPLKHNAFSEQLHIQTLFVLFYSTSTPHVVRKSHSNVIFVHIRFKLIQTMFNQFCHTKQLILNLHQWFTTIFSYLSRTICSMCTSTFRTTLTMLLCHYARWFPQHSFCQIFTQFPSNVPGSWDCIRLLLLLFFFFSLLLMGLLQYYMPVLLLALLLLISLSACVSACLPFQFELLTVAEISPAPLHLANSFFALNNWKSVFGFSAEFNTGAVEIAVRSACRTTLSSTFCFLWPTCAVLYVSLHITLSKLNPYGDVRLLLWFCRVVLSQSGPL